MASCASILVHHHFGSKLEHVFWVWQDSCVLRSRRCRAAIPQFISRVNHCLNMAVLIQISEGTHMCPQTFLYQGLQIGQSFIDPNNFSLLGLALSTFAIQ